MGKGAIIGILAVLSVAGIGGTGYFGYNCNEYKKQVAEITQTNQALQARLTAIGDLTTCYTVSTEVTAGTTIQEEHLVPITVPVSVVTMNTVQSPSDIVGKEYKIGISSGTLLTTDLVMTDYEEAFMYDRDMTFSYLPLGLQVGDYIDIRMTLPYGEEFIVFEHKRVYAITDTTIKVKMSEADLVKWSSLQVDEALYKRIGLSVYVTKYLEPGINDSVNSFYPVRTEVESMVNLNPNITNKQSLVNSSIRQNIQLMVDRVSQTDGSLINSSKSTEASDILSASQYYVPSISMTGSGMSDGYTTSTDGTLEEIGSSIDLNSSIN